MNTSNLYSVKWGASELFFAVFFEARKHIKIAVNPDQSIEVFAPSSAEIDLVFDKVRKRALWIKKQLNYFNSFASEIPMRKYISGETHKYLGRQYRLKVELVKDKSDVKLSRGYITVKTAFYDEAERIKSLLFYWYKERAEKIILQTLKNNQFFLKKHNLEIPGYSIKVIKKRWGSCSKNGHLSFNIELIKFKKSYLEYVVLHELCHLVEYNHTDKFYFLMSKYMPDWQKQKEALNKNAELSL